VKFGIFYEHQLPRPWSDTSEQQLINDALDQIELADALGVQYVWEVEHHFLEEYSHSSAPEVFLAAASQRTKRMRIGHGVVQTAPRYNHPARIAERIAMLDLVSNGRVEFGTGESSSEAELGGFGVDRDTKRDAWLEGLWVACSRRDTILLAAEKGIGALSFAFVEPEDARQWVEDYAGVLADRCVPVGLSVNPQVACVTPMMCAPREEDALARGLEGANFFGYSLAHYYVFGEHTPATTDVWEEFLRRRGTRGFSPEAALAAKHETLGAKAAAGDQTGLRGAVGTPAQLREFLRRYEEAGVDQLIFVMQAGHNRHEHIMESIELFGTQVLPEFLERDEAAAASKAAAWEPLIERALARKDRTHPEMDPDYVMRAIPKQMVDALDNEPAQRWLEELADKQAAGVHDEEFQRLVDG
jgi:alkanesulfonate monooxygenase SsuD/methylene tetrahydromethanopterin reductase-like flavin-dependent oxidoreductase (luciferase family)